MIFNHIIISQFLVKHTKKSTYNVYQSRNICHLPYCIKRIICIIIGINQNNNPNPTPKLLRLPAPSNNPLQHLSNLLNKLNIHPKITPFQLFPESPLHLRTIALAIQQQLSVGHPHPEWIPRLHCHICPRLRQNTASSFRTQCHLLHMSHHPLLHSIIPIHM